MGEKRDIAGRGMPDRALWPGPVAEAAGGSCVARRRFKDHSSSHGRAMISSANSSRKSDGRKGPE
jgi:hypothetical protein